MITTNSRIEDKKLLGLILPRNTMETSLCVQDAPCITQEFALSSVEFATRLMNNDSLRSEERSRSVVCSFMLCDLDIEPFVKCLYRPLCHLAIYVL
ncbi:hypothetical protein Tco_0995626 [Tanacetum coccineum]